jgi:hypothetical protein
MKRYPTDEEFNRYDGMHCRVLWKTLPHDWRCPVCNRNKREILQWGRRNGSNAIQYGPLGWKAGIHGHHDHGDQIGQARFSKIHICGGCNSLDGRLKKRIGAKKSFSFSPNELKQCLIAVRPNEKICDSDVDLQRAVEIYSIRCLLPRD